MQNLICGIWDNEHNGQTGGCSKADQVDIVEVAQPMGATWKQETETEREKGMFVDWYTLSLQSYILASIFYFRH